MTQINRRHFLKAGSTLLALPALEAFAAPAAKASQAKNFVAIGTWLGWHQNAFFPKQAGQDYEMPVTLSPLSGLRDEFTIFSGLDHRSPGLARGTGNENTTGQGAPRIRRPTHTPDIANNHPAATPHPPG